MVLKSFAEMQEQLKAAPATKRLAVVNAVDEHTVEAVILAKKQRLVEPVLIGDQSAVIRVLNNFGVNKDEYMLIHANSPVEAAQTAVNLVREKKADSILKGAIQTRDLLKAVVNSQTGIKAQRLLSHVCLNAVPGYHKVLVTTDGAMVLQPSLEEKVLILENALLVLKRIGYTNPKVAVLESNEIVNPKQQDSIDAATIKEWNQAGEIKDCIVEGPISLDLALDKEACIAKGYHSEVGGDADILLCPNLTVANVLTKSLQTIGKAKSAGVIMGALAPIVLVSRASSTEEKLDSIILSLLVS
jgi:phosphate butyryltransferase